MDINTLIKNALKDVGLPNYFLKRLDETKEAIVYNYIEMPNIYGDMKECSTKYTVLLNLYNIQSNIVSNKKKVKDAILNAGFKKALISATVQEQNGLYNTAMTFKIALVNQLD